MSDEKNIIRTSDVVPFYDGEKKEHLKKDPIEDVTKKAITTRNVVPYGKTQKPIKDKVKGKKK